MAGPPEWVTPTPKQSAPSSWVQLPFTRQQRRGSQLAAEVALASLALLFGPRAARYGCASTEFSLHHRACGGGPRDGPCTECRSNMIPAQDALARLREGNRRFGENGAAPGARLGAARAANRAGRLIDRRSRVLRRGRYGGVLRRLIDNQQSFSILAP